MKGKIVLVPFPFTDLTAAKLRPALVVYEGEKDAVIGFISSKIPSEPSEVDNKNRCKQELEWKKET